MPLLTEVRRDDDQNLALPFGPFLGKNETRLDGLAETDFIGEQGTFGEGRVEGKQSRIHLMRVQIDLSAGDDPCQFFKVVG